MSVIHRNLPTASRRLQLLTDQLRPSTRQTPVPENIVSAMTSADQTHVAFLAPENFQPRLNSHPEGVSVFLAGSIEMGKAEEWQPWLTKHVFESFEKDGLAAPVTVLNPRRKDWDGSWKQSIHEPKFKEQVVWELDAQDAADVIAMYFDPNTKAPISLMELGHYASSGKMIVCCPEGYWRKGNVEVLCDRYKVPLLSTKEELVTVVTETLKRKADENKAKALQEELKRPYLPVP